MSAVKTASIGGEFLAVIAAPAGLAILWIPIITVHGGFTVKHRDVIVSTELLCNLKDACWEHDNAKVVQVAKEIGKYNAAAMKLKYPVYMNKDGNLYKLSLIE